MNALEWRLKMPVAPKLTHSDGITVVQLGERVVLFPDEASTRFFVEAYTAVPALEGEVATLRKEIDEGALHAANAQIAALEADKALALQEIVKLEQRLQDEVERRTAATARATVLTKLLRRVREQL